MLVDIYRDANDCFKYTKACIIQTIIVVFIALSKGYLCNYIFSVTIAALGQIK